MSEEKFKKVEKSETKDKPKETKEKVKENKEPDFKIAELFSELLIGLIASPFRYLNLIAKKLYFYGGKKVSNFFHVTFGVTILMTLLSQGYLRLLWSLTLVLVVIFYFLAFNNNPVLDVDFSLNGMSLKNQLLNKFNKVRSDIGGMADTVNKENSVQDYENSVEDLTEEVVEDRNVSEVKEESQTNRRQTIEPVSQDTQSKSTEAIEELDKSINEIDALFSNSVVCDLEDKPINKLNMDELIREQPEVKKEVEKIDNNVSSSMEDFFKAFADEYTSEAILETKSHKEFVAVSEGYSVEDDL